MAVELPGIRPAVISEQPADELDRYRCSRHVVRNAYAYVLGPRRVGELVEGLPSTLARPRAELTGIAEALDEIAQC